MPKDVAELLGLNLNGEVSPAFGIGGEVNAVESNLNLIVEKGHERYPLEIPVKVIMDDMIFQYF